MRDFFISALLIISFSMIGQQVSTKKNNKAITNIKFDPEYFILGTLSDYMGRFTYVNKNYQIDRYYSFEKPLMEYIENMIEKENNIDIITTPDNELNISRYETFSTELSLEMNSYFYNNHLIIDSLKNIPNLNCSYLAGRYYRYGRKINNSIYSIQIANSADHLVCDSLLRRVGCTKIHFKSLKNIPAQFIYYFIPTPGLKIYLDNIEKEKVKLEDSFREYLKSYLKLTDQDLKKFDESTRRNDTEIINLFKNNGL